jgi:uncharacterized beta-barrel protein YwiB (DUF1934 family)
MALSATEVPIKLHLTTQVTQEGQTENFEFFEDGTLVRTERADYIRYVEHGPEGVETPVTFKITAENVITLTRRTHTDVHLTFVHESRKPTRYATPAGTMLLDVETRQLNLELSEVPFSASLDIDYALYQGDLRLGDYHLQLTVVEKS